MEIDRTKLNNEVSLIRMSRIRSIVKDTLLCAPGYFWVAPASTTGKYHTPETNGKGGLIIHTKQTVKVAYSLCETFDVNEEDRDYIIAACILHDIVKEGYPNSKGSMFIGHGYMVAQVMYDAGLNTKDDKDVQKILSLISTHMGKWDIPYKSVNKLPVNNQVVHLADYIASRCFIKADVS